MALEEERREKSQWRRKGWEEERQRGIITSLFPPEILGTYRRKVTLSFLPLDSKGHRAAKQLINTVVCFGVRSCWFASSCSTKLKSKPTVQRSPENTTGISQHALNRNRSLTGEGSWAKCSQVRPNPLPQGNKYWHSLTCLEFLKPGQHRACSPMAPFLTSHLRGIHPLVTWSFVHGSFMSILDWAFRTQGWLHCVLWT